MALRLKAISGGAAPVITGLPVITGTATQGLTLTATPAAVSGTPAPTRTWQWKRGGANISGATSATYTLVLADVGETITVVQSEANLFATDTAESSATGTVAGLGGGTASIVIDDDPTVPVAPAGFTFSITLGPEFSTPAPVAPEVYDRRDHEVYYYWDFGEGYTYTAPTRVFTEFKNSRYAFGSKAAHMFRAAGTHTVTCLVVEPATGVSATATTTVTVEAPSAVFTTSAQTMILDSTGAGLAAYPGSSVYTTWSALISALDAATSTANEATTPRQIIIRRGQTFSAGTTSLTRNGPWPTTLWRASDEAGARPVLNVTGSWTWRDDNSAMAAGVKGITFQNIDFRGNWNSEDETFISGTATIVLFDFAAAKPPKHMSFDGCRFAGLESIMNHNLLEYAAAIYINDTEVTDWRFYGILPNRIGGLFVTGSAFHPIQTSNAGGPKDPRPPWYNNHGPIRIGGSATLLVHSSDLVSRNGWTKKAGDIYDQQPIIRYDTAGFGGGYCNVQASILEGGTVMFDLAVDTDTLTNRVTNTIVEKNYLLASHATSTPFAFNKGGTTARNNIVVVPNTSRFTGYTLSRILTADATAAVDDADNAAAPQRFYSNTYINLYTTPLAADEIIGFADAVNANNLVYQPNATPALTSQGPLDTTQAFTPRELGYKHNASHGTGYTTLDTTKGTPAADVWMGGPAAGAGAIAAATTGLVAYDDFFGRPRETLRAEPFSIGAIEVPAA